jgi:hypothetical protein
VVIFELENEFFDEFLIRKCHDKSFEIVRFVCSAVEAGLIIARKFVAIWAYFRMGHQKFFACFAQIIAWCLAIDAGSGKNEIKDF